MSIDRIPLDPQRILLRLSVQDRDELLAHLCTALSTAQGLSDSPAHLRELIQGHLSDREGIAAEGFVCLLLRVQGLPGLRISLATLLQPISWGARGEAVQAVAVIATPHDNPAPGLRLYEQMVELSQRRDVRSRIGRAQEATELVPWLERELNEDDSPLKAAEIMRKPYFLLPPRTPLPELTRLLVGHNLDAVGIVDDTQRLVGEVTADAVFTLGMPDFFRQLKSVSFIADFDPLQKYFRQDNMLTAGDVMHTDMALVPPEATLLEVLFLLSVRKYPKVYVVDAQQTLLGVIDRIRVLDRIINL